MKIVCFGDSITRGQFSFNWVKRLSNEFTNHTFINSGINGELTYHLLQRVDDVKNQYPDLIFILVGTNDIYSITSETTTKRYVKNAKLPQVPSKDWFVKNLNQILLELSTMKSKIVLITIPPLGEDLNHFANQWVRDYNREIAQLKEKYLCDTIDLHEKMVNYLKENHPGEAVQLKLSLDLVIKAIFKKIFLFYSWDKISKSFGLTLTTDTIHLNETSGLMLTDLIRNYLNDNFDRDENTMTIK
jgi:acyl-CoA thioesterase I